MSNSINFKHVSQSEMYNKTLNNQIIFVKLSHEKLNEFDAVENTNVFEKIM